MAIAVEAIFEGPGATLDNYNQSITKMGATPGGPHPDPDCLFHWVTDVWTGKAEFDRFAAEKIGPVGAEVGVPQPKLTYIDVDNYLTAGSPSPL